MKKKTKQVEEFFEKVNKHEGILFAVAFDNLTDNRVQLVPMIDAYLDKAKSLKEALKDCLKQVIDREFTEKENYTNGTSTNLVGDFTLPPSA
jgi:hypothetical protein